MIKKFFISSIIFFILLIFVDKIIFLIYGNKYNIYNLQSSSDRNIILREIKPNLEVEVSPGKTYIRTTQGLQDKKYKLKTDNDGFIVNSNSLIRDNEENADIIFFGGSTTELMFVEEKNRFPYLTGVFLTKKIGRPKAEQIPFIAPKVCPKLNILVTP